MKLYEVEVVVKITVHGTTEMEAKARAVAWAKEQTKADEAAWLSCREKSNGNAENVAQN